MTYFVLSKPKPKMSSRTLLAKPVQRTTRHGTLAPEQLVPFPFVGLQAKLKISQPGDRYEQEADRVADQVMRMPDKAWPGSGEDTNAGGKSHTAPIQIQRLCSECEEERLQPKRSEGSRVAPVSDSAHWVPGMGQTLPRSLRSFYEPRFGQAFNQVKIHTGHTASQLAQSIQAKAFTLGNHIVFNAGEYQPQSHRGRTLLAHELTHVVQQQGGLQQINRQPLAQIGPGLPSLPDPDVECKIDFAALARILAGDRAAARKVIDCCLDVPVLGRGCSSQVIKAACELLPKLCGGGGGKPGGVRCPLRFTPAKSDAFKGKCCREGTVVESDRDCCFGHQITVNALFPRCCPPNQMPDGAKRDCIELPPLPTPDVPLPDPRTPTPPVGPPAPVRLSPMTLFFFFDSTIRRPESNESFERVFSILQIIPRLRVHLMGHASLEGSASYNLQLGQRRADAVQDELVLRGIERSRMATFSAGEATPAVPEPDIEGRSLLPNVEEIRTQNRRVEVIFMDPEGEFAPTVPPVTLRQPELRLPPPRLTPSLGIP